MDSDYTDLILIEGNDGNSYFGLHHENFYNPTTQEVTLNKVSSIRTDVLNREIGLTLIHLANATGLMAAFKRKKLLFNAVMSSGGTKDIRQGLPEKIKIPTSQIRSFESLPDYLEPYSKLRIKKPERVREIHYQ